MRYLYHGRTYIDDMHTICILSLMLQAIYPESPVVGLRKIHYGGRVRKIH